MRVLVACATGPSPAPPPGAGAAPPGAGAAVRPGTRAAPPPESPLERQRRRSRAALRLLLGLLGIDRDTASLRFPHRRFSLSHTETMGVAAGVVAPLPWRLAGVGVDIEPERPVDPRTARFFLTGPERDWLSAVDAGRRGGELLRLWTVKEALFKADPANRGTTLAHYQTRDPAAPAGPAGALGTPDRATPAFGYASRRLFDAFHLTVAASFRGAVPTTTRSTHHMPTTITFDQVAERVSATLSVPVEKLTPDTSLDELAVDSFRLVEMVVDLQEEFDSMFTQAELKQLSTLGELVELLRTH
jgi:acyl carrier protein